MEDVIANYIGARRALLIPDSLEHLLEAAPFIGTLLAKSPNLHVMATSQSVLRLSGEHSVAIGPLPVPQSRGASLHAIESVDATMLFLDRARAIQGDFGQHESEASSIAEIVRRLDGIPLAIEIAASRAIVLTLQSLLTRLDEGLLDFAEISRDRPERQQTLCGQQLPGAVAFFRN